MRRFLVIIGLVSLLALTIPAARGTNSISFGSTVSGNLTAAGQSTAYEFSANNNDLLDFTMSTNGFSPQITVYDSQGKQIGEANNGFCNGSSVELNTLKITATGNYSVVVSACNNQSTGTYNLYVQRTNAPGGPTGIGFGSTTAGSTSESAENNTYTFTANQNDMVDMTMSTNGFSPKIRLYAPNGSQVGAAVNGFCNGSSVEMNTVTLPAKGTYTVLVTACDDQSSGKYALYLQRTNNPGAASELLFAQSQAGTISSAAQNATYIFDGTASDKVNFTISTDGFSPKIRIYNPSGSQLLEANNGFCNGSSLVANGVTVSVTGNQTVLIGACNDQSTGKFTVSTQCFGVCLLPAPTISSIKPAAVLAGSGGFTLTVNGSNFVNVNATSVVQWNGGDLTTTFVNTGQLTAAVPAGDIATAQSVCVTVFTPTPGGGTSKCAPFDVDNPKPAVTSIAPISIVVGTCPQKLTINGSGFNGQTEVLWNGSALATTLVSSTQVTAVIPCSDLTAAGTVPVSVSNPSPGGGIAGPVTFTINNPAPGLSKISPQTITAGNSSATTLTVTGTGFVSTSTVDWNGSGLATTYVSGTQLTATIPASNTACGTAEPITVVNPTPGGGTSGPITFTANNPVPTLTSISPTNIAAGSTSFTLTVNGSKFLKGCSVVQWNGSNLTTTFVSSTQLTATVPTKDVAANGSANVTVMNPTPGGGTTSAQSFTVGPFPLPVLNSISPTSATAGGAAFTLTLNGSSFVQQSTANWNGVPVTTTYVNSSKLTAAIPALDIASAGYIPVTVSSPTTGGGGGTSGSQTFTVNNPLPKATTLSPGSIPAGSLMFTLTVNGSNFVSNSVVQWNGTGLATVFVNSGQLTATVPAASVTAPGSAAITVLNKTPGGGTSSPALTFTIGNPLAATPVITPPAGSYGYALMVAITEPSSTAGATIYYTANGDTPSCTTAAKHYTGPFLLLTSATINAIACAPNFTNSNVASSAFLIGGSPTVEAMPAINVTTSGATVRAFVNGHDLAGTISFNYGTSSKTLSSSTPVQSFIANPASVTFTAALTGLNTKTTYYYQAVVTTAGGTSSSAILSFTTP